MLYFLLIFDIIIIQCTTILLFISIEDSGRFYNPSAFILILMSLTINYIYLNPILFIHYFSFMLGYYGLLYLELKFNDVVINIRMFLLIWFVISFYIVENIIPLLKISDIV